MRIEDSIFPSGYVLETSEDSITISKKFFDKKKNDYYFVGVYHFATLEGALTKMVRLCIEKDPDKVITLKEYLLEYRELYTKYQTLFKENLK